MRVVPRAQPLVSPEEELPFSKFVQACFAQRRKQLARTLRSVATLEADASRALLESIDIDPTARGETLSPERFVELFRAIVAARG